jgi:hypothetical protein
MNPVRNKLVRRPKDGPEASYDRLALAKEENAEDHEPRKRDPCQPRPPPLPSTSGLTLSQAPVRRTKNDKPMVSSHGFS